MVAAWTLWAQTRVSPPGMPIEDRWEVLDTFPTQAACEAARVAVDPLPAQRQDAAAAEPLKGTRYVCFPDTVDPRATP